MEKRTGIC